MSAFHSSDYTIASTDDRMAMDDISLSSSSSSRINGLLSSSGASVASKFGRIGGRGKSMQNSDLGTPLTHPHPPPSPDERDEDGNSGWGAGGGASSDDACPPMNDHGFSSPPWGSSSSSPAAPPTASTKSYISEDDPFYMFRSDLVQKLAAVRDGLDGYLTVVRDTDTAANAHEVRDAKRRLKRHIKLSESTLSDLETTVRVVERRREKFPHIHDAELSDRRRFVDDSKDAIASSKMSMQSEEVRRKIVSDERAMMERRRGGGEGDYRSNGGSAGGEQLSSSANGSSATRRGYGYGNVNGGAEDAESGIDPERSETLLMMRRQDETLDDLDMAVTRVSYMAETINEELETQNVMLKNLEDDLADAEEQLGAVMGKLAKLLKTKSKCQLGLILILSLVVLVLFFLVLYT
jgi:hypothetical protein